MKRVIIANYHYLINSQLQMSNVKRFYIVIDDDKINNMICESIIKKLHPENKAMSFLRAEDALAYLQNSANPKPDVILLDINMPEMDGWEFLETYEKTTSKNEMAHVFILSSSINQADFDKAKNYPEIVDYIVKPFSKDKLLRAIEMIN